MLSNEQLIEKWEKFLDIYCRERILEAAVKYPDVQSIYVDFSEIDRYDPSLAEYLLEHPNNAIYTAKQAVLNMDLPAGKVPLNFRVRGLPGNAKVEIRDLRSAHLGKFVAIKPSLVKRAVQVKPKLEDAVFQCMQCGAIIRIPQTESELREPVACPTDQGGCGRRTSFHLLTEQSVLVDSQKIEIQEKPEGLRGGAQPQRLVVYLENDLAGKISPGDRVVINGILMGSPRRIGTIKQREFSIVFIANSVEIQEQAFEEIDISPEDVARILELSKDPMLYDKLINSIAPEIFGLRTEKEALMLQLFGGVPKPLPSGSRIRGDLHVLLVGDPGCLVGDERVVLGNGAIVKIKDLGKKHLEDIDVQLLTGQGYKRDTAKVFHAYKDQPVLEVTTESGKSIKGTYNHPLLVVKGGKRIWKRMDEIKPGDRVATVSWIPCTITAPVKTGWVKQEKKFGPRTRSRIPQVLDKSLGGLLGYVLGDGWITKHKICFLVAPGEMDVLDTLLRYARESFGIEPKVYHNKPKKGRKVPLTRVDINDADLARCLSFLREKRVPDIVMRSGNAVVSEFVAWLFEADGCVFSNGRGRGAIQLKSASVELLRDVQMLLMRFGIHSRIAGRNLAIKQAMSIFAFNEHIGFRSAKKINKLKMLIEDCKKLDKSCGKKRGERVVSVMPAGRADVYDVEIPASHRFIANGIISHNTAKSMLAKYISLLAPRAMYTSGKSASAAGLTAAAVRDPFGEGGWTLEAGALVLADMGTAIVDELDKMSPEDRSALHQAMEQQEVSIAKAGITATLHTRCSLLVAANPKTGRFDPATPIADQVSDIFPPTLLSRFDLIFVVKDVPEPKEDEMMAEHILSSHRAGEMQTHVTKIADGTYSEEEVTTAMRPIKPELTPDDIKKYITYAKKNVFPVMTLEAFEEIKSYYLNLRRQAKGQSVPITARQLESFVRLAEASARVRLSSTVTLEDAKRAIHMMEYCLKNIGFNRETGTFDIDLAYTGISGTQRGRISRVLSIIKRLCAENKEGASRQKIIDEAVRSHEKGLDEVEVAKILDRLKSEGTIYQPSAAKDIYRLTSE